MATLDNFGFKARKSNTTTRVLPSAKVIGERSASSSFIVPVDIKPIINNNSNNNNNKRKYNTTAITKSQTQAQQRTITNYFNKEEEEEEEEVITCTLKQHISSSDIWKMLENEYTSLIPTPRIAGDNNKRRVIETNRNSLLKRQRTMDSLSEIMDRYLNVSDKTSFEIITQQENDHDDEVLIRPVKKFTAEQSQLLFYQITSDFIPF